MSKMKSENEKPTSAIVRKDVCTVTENPSKNDIRIVPQMVILARWELLVVVMFTMTGVQLTESKPLVMRR